MTKKLVLSENSFKLLMEFLTSVIYHFTDEEGLEMICRNNIIPLTKYDKYYTNYEQNDELLSNGYSHYLSFTRVRNSNVGYGSWKFTDSLLTVRLQLDGDLLNNNYHGEPVDYFKVKSSTNDQRFIQSEDRLFSDEEYIEDASKYIVRIDVLLNDEVDIEWFKGYIDKLKQTSELGEKIFAYVDKEKFNFQR